MRLYSRPPPLRSQAKGLVGRATRQQRAGLWVVQTGNTTTTNRKIITTNRDLIATNRKIIATNRDTIATNRKIIATNRNMIAANRKRIAANRNMIATNKKIIATNRLSHLHIIVSRLSSRTTCQRPFFSSRRVTRSPPTV